MKTTATLPALARKRGRPAKTGLRERASVVVRDLDFVRLSRGATAAGLTLGQHILALALEQDSLAALRAALLASAAQTSDSTLAWPAVITSPNAPWREQFRRELDGEPTGVAASE